MIRSATIRNKVYKFAHKQDVWIQTNITGQSFSNQRLQVEESGKIKVKCSFKKGYAWDGCSPKFNFMHFTWGTPDGRLDYATEKPLTYYATLFHDALYQFKGQVCLSRKKADVLFKILLKQVGFIRGPVYYCAVRIFGGCYGRWKRWSWESGISVEECSWGSSAIPT